MKKVKLAPSKTKKLDPEKIAQALGAELPVRLAKGLTDQEPREWTAQERYMLYSRGFSDGAGFKAMRPGHEGLPGYDRGYSDGQKARNNAVTAFCKEIGHEPTILRTQAPP